MHRCIPLVVALLAAGCGPKRPDLESPIDPNAAPVLPAPEAGNYALGEELPKDPLVAKVVDNGMLPWVESLSGAATSLALDNTGPISLQLARHAAWRAGYPYPVVRLIEGEEEWAAFPYGLLNALKRQVKAGDHVGVVRARVGPNDRWLALVGRPQGVLDPFPRVVSTGTEVLLQADRRATWTAVRPDGAVLRGATPGTLTPELAGEWWLEVLDEDGEVLAEAPLWVGVTPEPGPLLDLPGDPPLGPEDARLEALDLIDEIRDAYGHPRLPEDELLTSLAQLPAEQRAARTWTREAGQQRLFAAGFEGTEVVQLTCSAPTVASCIDGLLHQADGRAGLLHPQVRLMGAAAVVSTDSVHLALNLTSE